jgi:quaternary ammonium compound-resistance protein SugE
MAWVALLAAGLVEIAGALGLKYSDGFSKPLPTLATVAAVALSFALLTLSLRAVPLGTAYAVWTGIGAVGTAILGIALFGESADIARLVCIGLIVVGMIGLKIAAPG